MSALFKAAHLAQIPTSKDVSAASKLANPFRVTSALQITQTSKPETSLLFLGIVVLTTTLTLRFQLYRCASGNTFPTSCCVVMSSHVFILTYCCDDSLDEPC